jgi:hypothetical protein
MTPLLLVGCILVLAWLSERWSLQADTSRYRHNTLSTQSRDLLTRMQGPLTITAWLRSDQFDSKDKRSGNRYRARHRLISALVERYRRYKTDIHLQFIDPRQQPVVARQLNIHPRGELVVSYRGRYEKVQRPDEAHISNALMRLASRSDKWVIFLQGHGERSPFSSAEFGLSRFAQRLKQRGMHIQVLNLTRTPVIPDNTSVLVIASPRKPFTEAEAGLIRTWLARGGNLLWLSDPDSQSVTRLQDSIGIRFLPGTVLTPPGPTTRAPNPALLVLDRYPGRHPLTRHLQQATIFPFSRAVIAFPSHHWHVIKLLSSDARSWTETGNLHRPPLRFDPNTDERAGPLNIGIALSRKINDREQHVLVVGDGDFISNAWLVNGGNSELGLNMIHWLAHDYRYLAIPSPSSDDVSLQLGSFTHTLFSIVYPFVIPALLLIAGFMVSRRRRRA